MKYIWLVTILFIGIIIGLVLERYFLQSVDVQTIVLAITLIVIIIYTYLTGQIAKVSTDTYKTEHQPIINYEIAQQVIDDDLKTIITIINHSIYHGALKIVVDFYLFANGAVQRPIRISNNDYYNGKIAWLMAPKGVINGGHFSIIQNLDSIKSEDGLAKYYTSNGKLWMRVKAECLDTNGKTVSGWSRDWYLQMSHATKPHEWVWIYEIDQNKLNNLITASSTK